MWYCSLPLFPLLFFNRDQMSSAMAELLNHHKSSHQLLVNGRACTHSHANTHSLGWWTHKTQNCMFPFMCTENTRLQNRFLPSFLRTASQLCSRHASIVITSGLNYKFSFTLLGGGKQFQNFIQRQTAEKKSRNREREWEEKMRALLAFRFEGRWGFLSKKKISFSVSLYWWSHKSAHTNAYIQA